MQIIAGLYKGRNLLPPPGRSRTRPITGLAKKSLFSMLGDDFSGRAVVDLYCGTGTLGLEALSRGAELCALADSDRFVIQRLRRNIQAVGAVDRCIVWGGDVRNSLPKRLLQLDRPIDVTFVDPPFASARSWSWEQIVDRIFAPLSERLADDGVVALRLPSDVKSPEQLADLHVQRRRKYGGMEITLLGLE